MNVFIIAEIGINHNGSMMAALELIKAAKDAGADAVKFQSYDVDKLGYADEALNELLRKCRADDNDHVALKRACDSMDIEFMSTPFDEDWVDRLVKLGVKRLKVSSGKVKDEAFVRHIASKGLPVIISNGMASREQCIAADNILHERGCPTTWLYCVSEYPAPLYRVDFSRMLEIPEYLSPAFGFSDHTEGVAAPILAAAMGASVIECHLTLDKAASGPDHRASKTPAEFREIVKGVRCVG